MPHLIAGETDGPPVATGSSAAVLAADIVHAVHTRVVAGDPATVASGLRLLGRGRSQIVQALARLEPSARRSVWGMHPMVQFNPVDLTYELNDRSARRGLSLRQVTSVRALTANPLLGVLNPFLRIGPVAIKCILIDDVAAVLPGPVDATGDQTAWLVTQPDIVEMARRVWETTWATSAPVDAGDRSLTPRQAEVARGLVQGVADATLARRLGVSPRTVFADVSHLLDVLGVRTRAEAVFLLGGGAESPGRREP